MSTNVIFTGLYRHNNDITNLSLEKRIQIIKDNGVDQIYWFIWKGHAKKEVESYGVKIVEIDEPYPHIRGIEGRQRQIYNVKKAMQNFADDDILLKLRWDLDFNDTLIKNVADKQYFDPIHNGLIENKVWVGFYSIQELFSPADVSFAGYKKDLDRLINFEYKIDGVSANNYISHDGMMLMAKFIENNKIVKNLIKLNVPDPWSLMFKEEHFTDKKYLYAWAYNYYILNKYFKTGPLGTCYFKRGDVSRWPFSFVDYNNFTHNYNTVIGKDPKWGLYPKYRVYEDIFIQRVIDNFYDDKFSNSLYRIINENKKLWEASGV